MRLPLTFASLAVTGLLAAPVAQASSVVYFEDFSGQEGQGLFGEILSFDSFTALNGQWTILFEAAAATVLSEGAAVRDEIEPYPTASATLAGNEHFQWFEPEGPGIFTTTAVDITGLTGLMLSFDYFEIGDWESSDTSMAAYSVDGGATFTEIFSRDGETGAGSGSSAGEQPLVFETFSLAIPDGTSFIFAATVETSAMSEIAGLDNIKLSVVPLPASFLLMLGGLAALGGMRAVNRRAA